MVRVHIRNIYCKLQVMSRHVEVRKGSREKSRAYFARGWNCMMLLRR